MFSDCDRQMLSSPGLRLLVIAVAACLCLVELTDPPAFALDAPQAPGLPVIKVLNCRLDGLAVVCERGGTLLPNRDKKLRKKEPSEVPRATPGGTKSKSKASKSQSAKSKPPKGQSPKGSTTPAKDAAGEPAGASESETSSDSSAVGSAVEHSCPPGNVVLEKPNASGSYCEPAGKSELPGNAPTNPPAAEVKPEGTAASKPVTDVAPPVSSGSTEIPADIRAAACGPGAAQDACTCPNGSQYDSVACKAAIPLCCAAQVTADGKPQPVISACGADQNAAMNSVVSAAMAKKLSLGPVRCTNQ
jgi:hypothetical protein